MKTLARLPGWARVAVVLGYAGTAALTMAIWWASLWPNVVADGVAGVPAVVATSGLLVRRVKHEVAAHVAERVETRLAEQRDALSGEIKAHVDRALAAPPPQSGGGSS